MLPAQQPFKTHHFTGAHIDLGLIVQTQLPRRQCLTHTLDLLMRRLDLAPFEYIKQMEAVTATLFGHVHGLIRVAQQSARIFIVRGIEGDADTCANTEGFVAHRVRLRDGGQHALHGAAQLIGIAYMAHNQHEFVACQPRYNVLAPHDAFQPLGHFDQQQIATGMAVAIIDRLEAIQVEHAHRQRDGLGPRELQRAVQQLRQIRPVRQPGEHVVPHPPLQGVQ